MTQFIDPILFDESRFSEYRKKPLLVKAVQIKNKFTVKTLEGKMTGRANDYLVKGTHGEYYPVRRHIFESNYESFED